MSDTEITKLIGSPGSGKTTRLLEFADEEAQENDIGLGDVMFLTYSKTAKQGVTPRFKKVYPDAHRDDLEKRVKTLHGASLVACLFDGDLELRNHNNLDDSGQLVIRRNNDRDAPYFEWFFKSKVPQIEYDSAADDPIKQLEEGEETSAPAGNQLMALYDYLRNKNWDLDQYYQTPLYDSLDLGPDTTHEALQAWEEFKDQNDLIQDDDYVRMALENGYQPPTDVLFIDEFQDLSPLQTALYEQWRDSGSMDHIYIAGDVHQSIYGFRGVEPSYFRDTPADEVIHHEESKRCPEAIVEEAVPVVAPPEEHDVSRVRAWRPGGHVEHVDAPSAQELSQAVQACLEEHEQVYLLARTNRQTGKLAYGLREGGIPYMDLKPDGHLRRWKHPMPMLLAALRAYDNGKNLPASVATEFMKHASDAPAREEARELAEEGNLRPDRLSDGSAVNRAFAPDEYQAWFPNADRAADVVSRLTLQEWRRELLLGALRSGAENDPEDVRIGTVHSAKGLEAPCVMVFPAYSHSQLERFRNGAEAEERRLFYVAMTRSSKSLYIVHEYFSGSNEFPPLEAV